MVAGQFPEDILRTAMRKKAWIEARPHAGAGISASLPPSLALWAPLRACPGALAWVGSVSAVNASTGALGLNPCSPMSLAQRDASPRHCTPLRKIISQVSDVGGGRRHPEFWEPMSLESLFRVHPRSSIRARPATTPGFLLAHSAFPGSHCPPVYSPPERKPGAWGTLCRAPSAGQTRRHALDPIPDRIGTLLTASRTAGGPNGSATWRAWWSTALGTYVWDTAPRQGETHYQWGFRVDAIYDTHGAGMAEWIGKPLEAAPIPGEWRRAGACRIRTCPRGTVAGTSPRNETRTTTRAARSTRADARVRTSGATALLAMGGGPLDGATPSRTTKSGAVTRGRRRSPKEPKEDRGARGRPRRALVLPRYTGACRTCHNPIPRPESTEAVYDPQGDGPLPTPPLGGDLRGHTAEPIMLWKEAILNPSGPPEVGCAWPPAPLLLHVVAYYPDCSGLKLPYITSDAVAEAWRVDHNTLCGKFLGHRRRKWSNESPPPLFYIWKDGPSPRSPLGVALMPVWANLPIAYTGLLEDGSVIPGLYKPVGRMQDVPAGAAAGRSSPPSCHAGPKTGSLGVTCWWEKVNPQDRTATPRTRAPLPGAPTRRGTRGSCPTDRGKARGCSGRQWRAWCGTAPIRGTWNRPDLGTLRPGPGCKSAFVLKLQEYGSLSVQRFLDIDRVKIAHSVTKDIFPERGRRAALHTVHSPTPHISSGQARDYVLYRYGRLPEGWGQEAFGSTLADSIFKEISTRAETCRADVHYKVVDNRLVPHGSLRGARPKFPAEPAPPARH